MAANSKFFCGSAEGKRNKGKEETNMISIETYILHSFSLSSLVHFKNYANFKVCIDTLTQQ